MDEIKQLKELAQQVYRDRQQALADALAVEGVKPLDTAVCQARIKLRNAEKAIIAICAL